MKNQKINLELVNFLSSLSNIKGASFVGVKNYFVDSTRKNSKCIVSGHKNINISINVNRLTQKNNNRTTLLELDKNDFYNKFVFGKNPKFTFEIFNNAYNSVFDQCTEIGQTLSDGSKKIKDTNQQIAQKTIYSHICNGIKINNDTKELYLSGNFQSSSECDNLSLPLYKSSTKRTQTLIQDILKDELNLKSFQYRTLVLTNCDAINTSKITFDGKELYISL